MPKLKDRNDPVVKKWLEQLAEEFLGYLQMTGTSQAAAAQVLDITPSHLSKMLKAPVTITTTFLFAVDRTFIQFSGRYNEYRRLIEGRSDNPAALVIPEGPFDRAEFIRARLAEAAEAVEWACRGMEVMTARLSAKDMDAIIKRMEERKAKLLHSGLENEPPEGAAEPGAENKNSGGGGE